MNHEIHTYFHCRRCLEGRPPEEPLEIGMTSAGMLVKCPKHGKVQHFTPDDLRAQLAIGPACDCCSGAIPHA